MVKPFDLIKTAKQKLIHSETPQLDAEVILSHVLNCDRIYLFINRDKEILYEDVEAFNQLVERRSKGEPVAYITGSKEFMGLSFNVKPGVLIPRGDTEVLVEEVIKRVQVMALTNSNNLIDHGNNQICKEISSDEINEDTLVIVDIGCGSGAIAIALAKFIEEAVVYAVDIMDIPIETTIENAKINSVECRVSAIKSDLMNSLDMNLKGRIDVVVSNPPYIEQEEYEQLMEDVKNYEPISALTDEGDGLKFYRRITAQAAVYLKKGGLLAYEIGYNQAESVIEIMKQYNFYNIECIKDLGGKNRVVLGYFGDIVIIK